MVNKEIESIMNKSKSDHEKSVERDGKGGNNKILNLQMEAPNDLLEQISGIGKEQDRTRNGQILWFLKEGVKQYKSDPTRKQLHV